MNYFKLVLWYSKLYSQQMQDHNDVVYVNGGVYICIVLK